MKFIFYLIFISSVLFEINLSFSQKGQNHGWKEISNYQWGIEYLDTLNVDTSGNLIFFCIKTVYPDSNDRKSNPNSPDSTYILYYADIENPSLNFQSELDFYHNNFLFRNGQTMVIGGDCMNYGYGNLAYVNLYYRITGKELLYSPVKTGIKR
jgi:hypothetical protein